jgi:hypothetical protein
MAMVYIDNFTDEKECVYDGERYSVRDNGAVLRHPKTNGRERSKDDKWTFGETNSSNPYLHIASVRVHRIVATAFHGEPPDPKYVVDHIDSNCKNNRPTNLRWVTRLENTLNNPVTRKKIEYLCGSIEAFLENPSMLNAMNLEPNISWMRTVTPEEAQNCKVRMSLWASSNKKPRTSAIKYRSSFGERVYKPIQKWEVGLGGEPGLDLALTPRCAQYMWRSDAYFPCCPEEIGANPIEAYFQNLKVGATFAYSDYSEFCPKLTALEFVRIKNNSSVLIMCEREDRKWSIVGITLDEESGYFIHFYLGSSSSKEDADKAFAVKQELKDFWSDSYNSQAN